MAGRKMRIRFIITAGGTREPIDEVRYIGNTSTGRLGAAELHLDAILRHPAPPATAQINPLKRQES